MSEKHLNDYVMMLNNAKTDTEKFAALMLVAKLVKSEKCDAEFRKKIFGAIGFKFLHRLLHTETVSDGCSIWSYKSLAVTIFSIFCSDPELAVHPEMVSNLKQFNKIILSIQGSTTDIEEQNLINDTYDCLSSFAGQPPSMEALLNQQTVTALCQAISNKCYGWQKAQQLILYLVNICGSDCWKENIEGLHILLQHFTQQFKTLQDEGKFGVSSTLCIILSSAQKEQLRQFKDKQWITDLRESVFHTLQNKLGSLQRESVLKLATVAVDILGIEWTLTNEDTQRKFLLLLVHLCCIEIRIGLENGNYDQVETKANILCSCYLLLEHVISYMTSGPTLLLDDKQVRQLHSAMLGAFNAVLQFLSIVQALPPDKQENNFTAASVRVLGSWIAEETSALQEQVVSLIPFLLKISLKSIDQNNGSTPKSSPKEQSMDTDEEPMEDVLKFLLPGFCHLSSEENARKIFIQENGHQLLGRYFSQQYNQLSNQEQINTESQVALTTLCGVFLNVVVMEPDLVSTDTVFSELLVFLITTLPSLVENERNLILAFNMCVLCLMLLRHHYKKLQVSIGDCDKMFKSTVTLLWCHDHSTSGVACHLVLKEKYTDIWYEVCELWFLGMQAFNACVPLFPSLALVILKTGWIPAVLNALNECEGRGVDDVTRDSYCNLLLQLSLQGGDVKSVITDKGGNKLAQLYEFPSLSECLKT